MAAQPGPAPRIGFIGFGEAAPCIAGGLAEAGLGGMHAFDIAWSDTTHDVFATRAARSGTTLVRDPASLAGRSDLLFSLVTCSEAIAAARALAPSLEPRHLYVDFNSASPMVKREVATVVEEAGARFVEAAVMAVVPPHRQAVPVLLCGADAGDLVAAMAPYGVRMEVLGDEVGAASAAKMFRSIVVKGMQSLFIESLLAASRFGVHERVFDSISESFPGTDWDALAHYQIGRSALHALRQAHELDEVSRTLEEIGEDPVMSRATAERLHRFASLGLKEHFGERMPESYEEVLEAIRARSGDGDGSGP